MRKIATADELFDILSSIKGGVKVTIGYVTGANLKMPEVKMKNPKTNRTMGFHDYETFGKAIGEAGEVGGVVKLTSYSLNWQTPESYKKGYIKYKAGFDALRQEFGIDASQRRGGYAKHQDFGDKGISVYGGDNDEIKDHSYTKQNVYGAKINSVYYLVDMEGHIIREMDKSELSEFLNTKKPDISGVSSLREMGADDARIQEYIRREAELKFRTQFFETSHILYIVATANGEKILWVNEKLEHAVRNVKKVLNGVNVIPAEFMRIAKERYNNEIQESNTMKLNLNDIRYIVEEVTRRILRESTEGENLMAQACEKLLSIGAIEVPENVGWGNWEPMLTKEEMRIVQNNDYPIIWTITLGDREFRSQGCFETVEEAESDCENILKAINFYELAEMYKKSFNDTVTAKYGEGWTEDDTEFEFDEFNYDVDRVCAAVGGLGYFDAYEEGGEPELDYEIELSNVGFGFYD